ncbi:MAG: hypothetical protein KDK11_19580 [Maritimibacter sp.]|nr:hypothetical protein [Maritimibacter sp.]
MRVILSFLAFGLIVQSAPVAAQEIMEVGNMDQTCRNFYPGASPRGEEMKKVTFVNHRSEMVWPAWINLGGFVGVYPEQIPPGGSYSTYTRVGHRWMIVDGSNWECVQNFTISADTATYTIE